MRRLMFSFAALALFAGLACVGCVSATQGTEMQGQVDELQKRVEALEKQNADLKTRFDSSTEAAGQAVLGFNQIQQDMQVVQGKLDDLAHSELSPQQLAMLRRQVARQFEALDGRLATLEKKAAVKNPDKGNLNDFIAGAGMPAEAAAAGLGDAKPANEDDAFRLALSLYNQGNYETAKARFRDFLGQYKKSAKRGEAQFYLADSLFKQRNWEESILEFDTLVSTYPQSSRIATAYLDMGVAFQEKGQLNDAKLFYQKVTQQYPRSKEADVARKKLQTMK